ncbi:MAG: tetratricopeptide repeat protein [Thermomicrobiales bacterium]|nr:tetratricopeptide repeat protein [Thermomicrobiales bacterium]
MKTAEFWPDPTPFPAPALTWAAAPPTPLTSFIAREQELTEITALLAGTDVRLLTLTGPGGVGKTRLAIAVAELLAPDTASGVAFVELAPVRSASLVSATIAQALAIPASDGAPLFSALARALGRSQLVLVLDNFEHVLPAAPEVTTLLQHCPRLKVLVTSRAPLHVSGEHEYPVVPMRLAAPGDASPAGIGAAPAVRLFVERAQAVDPGFALTDDNAAVVAAICARLDGLPLAIELAAARNKVLSPALLLPRLAHRLPLLSGGPRDVPARLQTMQAAIAWSYDLLGDDERTLFRRLAVFVGGFDLSAAEAVAGLGTGVAPPDERAARTLDGITSLVDKSLVQVATGHRRGQRFTLLETIREFARERLEESGEGEPARTAHAAHFVAMDAHLDPNVTAPGERFEDRLLALEAEFPNFRAAYSWLVQAGDGTSVTRLAGALAIFAHHRGDLEENRRWIEWGLAHASEEPSVWRARALAGLSLVLWSLGDPAQAEPLAESAQGMAEAVQDAWLIALAIHLRGIATHALGHLSHARDLMEETLEVQLALGQISSGSMAMRVLGAICYDQGDLERASRYAHNALETFQRLGHLAGAASALELIARMARDGGETEQALAGYQEALRMWEQTDAHWSAIAGPHGGLGAAQFPRWASIDYRRLVVLALDGVAAIAAHHGDYTAAAALLGGVHRRRQAVDAHFPHLLDPHEQTCRVVAAALGPEPFAALYQQGQQAPLAEIVNCALAVRMGATAPDAHATAAATGPLLTSRQLEVLSLICAGRTDREIADTLFISRRTAQDHVSNLLSRLGAANRAEAASIAVRERLV